jgi:broad specificity phosphatase PhoE
MVGIHSRASSHSPPFSRLQKYWPHVQFDPSMSENDIYWSPDHRESWDALGGRVKSFLEWLIQRNEEHIVVVSHGVWIETCFALFSPGALGEHRVYNCDAYAAKLFSRNGQLVSLSDVRLIS